MGLCQNPHGELPILNQLENLSDDETPLPTQKLTVSVKYRQKACALLLMMMGFSVGGQARPPPPLQLQYNPCRRHTHLLGGRF